MRLEFDVTTEDYLAMHADWLESRPARAGVPVLSSYWPVLLVSFAGAGVYAVGRVVGYDTHHVVFGALNGAEAGCFSAAAALLVVLAILKLRPPGHARYLNVVRGMLESGALSTELGRHVAEIEGSVLIWTTPIRTITQPLEAIDATRERPDGLYLLRNSHTEYRIPARAFATEAERDEFRGLSKSTRQPHPRARSSLPLSARKSPRAHIRPVPCGV